MPGQDGWRSGCRSVRARGRLRPRATSAGPGYGTRRRVCRALRPSNRRIPRPGKDSHAW